MATAGDIIYGSLRLIGMLAEGETPSAETARDALTAFNQMLDSWSTERLAVYSTQDQTFTWPASTALRSIGPTGNFVGSRPVALDDSTYFRDASTGVSYGIKLINQAQYNGIALKTATSTYPQVLWFQSAFPDAEMTIYPVPTRALEWHFVSVLELTQPALLSTDIALPPGYLRALRFNLASELAAEFGIEPSGQVQRIAIASKRNIKRINAPDDQMSMPYSIVATRQRYSIYAGNY